MDTLIVETNARLFFTNAARVVRSGEEVSDDLAAQSNFSVERSNPFVKWIVGDFVEADNPNSNTQFWTKGDLALSEYSIRYSPLNMLHKQRVPIGFFSSTRTVDLTGSASLDQAQGTAKIEALAGMWSHVFPFESALIDQADEAGALFYCVDTETEILTERGWRRYDEVAAGDRVLGLDEHTGTSRWVRVNGMNYFPVRDQTLVRMEGQGHSSLSTPNHRWLVMQCGGTGSPAHLAWRTSETLTRSSHILRAAPHVPDESASCYSDAFVELVAWYWTEGHRASGAVISQSHAVNPANVERIRLCLKSLYGSPDRVRDGGRWYETTRGRMTIFHLSSEAARPLFAVCEGGEKVVRPQFLTALTAEQLELYIETAIDADGSRAKADGQVCLTQVSEARIRSFEMACALAGRPTNTQEIATGEQRAWRTCLMRRSTHFSPRRLAALGKGFVVEQVKHTGIVWCPTTETGTFLARRRGTVYWTGNSMECRGTHLHCAGPDGCDGTFDYFKPEDHCVHLKERSSIRHIVNPTFRGGAVIIPPTQPGWKNASATVMQQAVRDEAARYAEQTEAAYGQLVRDGAPLTPSAWEHLMGAIVTLGQR